MPERIKCPACGSEKVHETWLHDCLGKGIPYRCSNCFHTWCQPRGTSGNLVPVGRGDWMFLGS